MINSMARSLITAKKYYRSMLAGNDAFNPGSFDLISTTILSSDTASVTFDVSTLASTYKHLQIRYSAKSDRSSSDGNDGLVTRINGDSGTNYTNHLIYGQWYAGSTGNGVSAETAFNGMEYTYIAGTGGSSSAIFGSGTMDFLDAFSTDKFKTRRVLWHNGLSSPFQQVSLTSNLWRNTAAITSLTLSVRYGSNLVSGSRFSIYGIKG